MLKYFLVVTFCIKEFSKRINLHLNLNYKFEIILKLIEVIFRIKNFKIT